MAGSSKRPITIRETDDRILVEEGFGEKLNLSTNGARYLARKLNRLALRIEKRTAQGIEAATADETQSGSAEGQSR